MCRLCGHRQTARRPRAQCDTRITFPRERNSASQRVCSATYLLPISNYLHTRMASAWLLAECIRIARRKRVSRIFLPKHYRACLFLFVIIRNFVLIILSRGTLVHNFQIITALFLKFACHYYICYQIFFSFLYAFRYFNFKREGILLEMNAC